MHDRQKLYLQLWEHTDRYGILTKTQLELAEILNIPYQRLSLIYSEYQRAGYMKKYRLKFQMKSPETIRWDDFEASRRKS